LDNCTEGAQAERWAVAGQAFVEVFVEELDNYTVLAEAPAGTDPGKASD
jgi:hypothetical protein